MEGLLIKAEPRTDSGKEAARKVRKEGKVPAVLYGSSSEATSIMLEAADALRAVRSGHHTITLEVDGLKGKESKLNALIKEVQRNSLTDQIIHLDFQRVSEDQLVETIVPIVILNEEVVKKTGARVQHGAYEVKIKAAVQDLPEKVEVDIKDAEIGSVIRMKDLELSDKIEVLSHPDETITSVLAPKLKEEEEVVEEAETTAAEPELITKEKAEEE